MSDNGPYGGRTEDEAVEPIHDWPRPIPVSERLPEEQQGVLAYDIGFGWMFGQHNTNPDNGKHYLCGGNRVLEFEFGVRITHWLPLPPAP